MKLISSLSLIFVLFMNATSDYVSSRSSSSFSSVSSKTSKSSISSVTSDDNDEVPEHSFKFESKVG